MFKISVIIPSQISTHDGVEKLKEAISSLINQTISKALYEIIIIDDGSDINLESELKDFIDREDVSIVLRRQAKLGPATSRNLGIKEAKGEILFFLGDDVIAKPNLLEEHLKVHKNHDNCVVANPILTPSNENVFGIFTTLDFRGIKEETEYEIDSRLGFCTACVSVRKTTLGGELFDEDFKDPAYEDTELGIRLFKKGVHIVLTWKTDACHDHVHNIQSIIKQARNCGRGFVYITNKHPVRNILLTYRHNKMEYNVKKFFYGILYKLFSKIYTKSTQVPIWYAKIIYQHNIMLGIEEGKRLWLLKTK